MYKLFYNFVKKKKIHIISPTLDRKHELHMFIVKCVKKSCIKCKNMYIYNTCIVLVVMKYIQFNESSKRVCYVNLLTIVGIGDIGD